MIIKTKKPRMVRLEQWVDVTTRQGKTLTTLYPSNEVMLDAAARMNPLPDIVYRRFHFRTGVPAEYHWATNKANRRLYGGMAIQRMSFPSWLRILKIESAFGNGHLGPCGALLPRPAETGGCDCPACTAASVRLFG